MTLFLVALALLVGSGLAAGLSGRRAFVVSAAGCVAGCLVGLVPAGLVLAGRKIPDLKAAWPIPGGAVHLEIDALSAFFLVPIFVLGGIAALCFVRLLGVALLGEPRHEASRHAHESGPGLTRPMAALAFVCVTLAVAPLIMRGPLEGVMRSVAGRPLGTHIVTQFVKVVGIANAAVLAAIAVGGVVAARLLRRFPATAAATWGCGYLAPAPRMQYTARSFAEVLSDRLLPRRLRGRTVVEAPTGLFPSRGEFSSTCDDPVTRDVYEPFFQRWATRCMRLRLLQQGELSMYLLYIMVALLAGLGWTTIRNWGAVR